MVKTIKVIGCAGVGAILILLLPLCLLRTERPLNGNGTHSLASNSAPPAPMAPASPPPVETTTESMRRLHRQKRYLLFPEGSSFQLVFDIIIPIIDYTNYAILGITCSVAWELPSKPPSELIENVLTRINDGTIGTVRRNGSAPEPEPGTPQAFLPHPPQQLDNGSPVNWQAVHAPPSNPLAYAANDHGRHSYYTNIQRNIPDAFPYANANANVDADANASGQQRQEPMPANWDARQSVGKWQQKGAGAGAGAAGLGVDNWWTRNGQRVQQNWREKQRMWGPSKWNSGYTQRPRQILQSPPKHHIYPVFARRRRRRSPEIAEDFHFERFHLQHHLSSRQLLLGKIERLYKSRRLNGTSCVQRALCESAQRQQRIGDEPQSFIMELLSAIFQLPSGEDIHEPADLELMMSPHYLEAHKQKGNCRQLYSDCSHTFWSE
ncbi:uncharacterized protein LOC110186230 [Drosophila serrata]|uniref:uncharacterized protein LOC110186230 n=1 Tax=Drosophila serrata TaxID=7274 RepID=UPI000A1CFB32|nr:uncharacterized protein LOC110186230 [Drosophila serrata]